jgi:archaeosine synthase
MPNKTLILKSGACSWGKCIFCGYGRIAGKRYSGSELTKEFDSFFTGVTEGDSVKIFGSGSFLDEKQVPADARKHFISLCKEKKVGKLFIESRPEFIIKEKLEEFRGLSASIAIGLEVADDKSLDKVNKGFHLRDYEKAAEVIHSAGFQLRTYLLVNPPYVGNIQDSLDKSVNYALRYSDTIVLINLLPHGNTPVFKMWVRGEWNYLSRDEFNAVVDKWRNNPKIEFDVETFGFVPKFPKEVMEGLRGVGENYLTHPHFEVWQDYLVRWFRPFEDKDVLLFLPCSFKKPYSQSDTHRNIINVLKKSPRYMQIHQVMLSNTGLVPREFENHYPFNAYDWDEKLETEEIKKRYVEVTARRIKKYLEAHGKQYKTVCCFMKYSSESYQALEKACRELNVPFTNLLRKETYEEIRKEGKPLQTVKALCDLEEGIKKI